ncbi:MAG: cytochrome c-type biogenesis protein, partial [Dehalococcoidia bacterium]
QYPFVLSGSRAFPGKPASISLALVLLFFALSIVGCIREEDITLEQRAHQLAGELMCPVCNGQTIDGSNAQIAQDMRLKVRELLDTGDTNADVKDYFVLRYGEEILAAPEGSGFNLLAWVVPVFIVLGGIGIALIAIKNMRKSTDESATHPVSTQDDLSKYLKQVDRDLGSAAEVETGGLDTNPAVSGKATEPELNGEARL